MGDPLARALYRRVPARPWSWHISGLAIGVVHAFVHREVAERDERTGLELLERVVAIAGDIAAVRVFVRYGMNPLDAVPLDDFHTTPHVHRTRWPRIRQDLATQRNALRKLSTRRR